MKTKIGMIGYFASGKSKSGGQEAKTCAIAEELNKDFGAAEVKKVDTLNWKKHPFKLFLQLVDLACNCKNVIMLPAHKSVKVFTPILVFLKKITGVTIHYAVVGGWLPTMTNTDERLKRLLKKVDYIYVETSSMADALQEQGFDNIVRFPNFKHIIPIDMDELFKAKYTEPYRLCFFARVTKEKGLEDAVDAVLSVNKKYGHMVYQLDVYGPVQGGQEEWFEQLKRKFSDCVKYRGFVEPEESVETLRDYFGMIFPTHYKTEGVPGTIIDAYAAGVPVVTARWDNCGDVIDEGVTGFGYELGNVDQLTECLNGIALNPERFISMKLNCVKKASEFMPEKIMEIMLRNLS